MTVVLRVEGVSFAVGGTTLLHDVTVALRHGTFHALVGPNGAGKSTLLRLLAGEGVPTAGVIYLDDRPLGDYSKQQLALWRAVMPQDVVMSFAFTGEEVVMMGRYPHVSAKADDHAAVVDRRLRETDADGLRDRLYPTLSGGEQARVTMARVLAQTTPILFLDEPTASLDPRHQHLVMDLAKLHAKNGGTVVAVLHDLNLVSAYADDIILLKDGRVRAQGSSSEILQPRLLDDVFQTKFYVSDHPGLSRPLVLSLPATK